ncbi:MAG: acyl-CoA dehydrogenase, partial [Deltaproteobacteria bacterium]|nr:acyl-CoA dehydrogenase [Deltaproteobacteria bacterium]
EEKGAPIRGFLVEKGTRGFTTRDIEGKLSLRASVTSELYFKECKIPVENLLPDTKELKSALSCLNQARYSIAWGALGAGRACYKEALEYAKVRVQFEHPIARYQLVQEKLVWMATEITKGQMLALRLGQLKDKGEIRHYQISMAKMNNVAAALKTARLARDILGANGICDDFASFRHMCNLESVSTYEGTHDIHLLVLGEEITGMSALT